MTTKRQKLTAMAEQTASPKEAAIAKTKLATLPHDLDSIAESIKSEWGKGIDAQFAIGRLLIEARTLLPGDIDFGKWLKSQDFGFTPKTANNLRRGAEREGEVRAFIAAQKLPSGESKGRDIGVVYAMDLLAAGTGRPQGGTGKEAVNTFPMTPADPAFTALRTARNLILGITVDEDGKDVTGDNAFLSMHLDDLVASAGFIKELAAAYNAAKKARE